MPRQLIAKIILGSDHAGLNYKQYVIRALNDEYPEIETVDIGCFTSESCDYTDFAHTVAQMVSQNATEYRGILICGTGTGMCITSNRYPAIRCASSQSVFQVAQARKNQDINVLSIGAQLITKTECMNMVRTFVDTEFESVDPSRHIRRLLKINLDTSRDIDYNALKSNAHTPAHTNTTKIAHTNIPTTIHTTTHTTTHLNQPDYSKLTTSQPKGKTYKMRSGFFGNRNSVYPVDVVVNNVPMVIKPNNYVNETTNDIVSDNVSIDINIPGQTDYTFPSEPSSPMFTNPLPTTETTQPTVTTTTETTTTETTQPTVTTTTETTTQPRTTSTQPVAVPDSVLIMTEELKQKQAALQENQKKLYEMLLESKIDQSDRRIMSRNATVPTTVPTTSFMSNNVSTDTSNVVLTNMDAYKKNIETMNSELLDLMQKIVYTRSVAKRVHGDLNTEMMQIFNVSL